MGVVSTDWSAMATREAPASGTPNAWTSCTSSHDRRRMSASFLSKTAHESTERSRASTLMATSFLLHGWDMGSVSGRAHKRLARGTHLLKMAASMALMRSLALSLSSLHAYLSASMASLQSAGPDFSLLTARRSADIDALRSRADNFLKAEKDTGKSETPQRCKHSSVVVVHNTPRARTHSPKPLTPGNFFRSFATMSGRASVNGIAPLSLSRSTQAFVNAARTSGLDFTWGVLRALGPVFAAGVVSGPPVASKSLRRARARGRRGGGVTSSAVHVERDIAVNGFRQRTSASPREWRSSSSGKLTPAPRELRWRWGMLGSGGVSVKDER